MRALVLVASPSNLGKYQLDPFDVEAAVSGVRKALGEIPCAVLANNIEGAIGPPTLEELSKQLTNAQEPYTLLHFVCHGVLSKDGETALFWATEDNQLKQVTGTQLLEELGYIGGQRNLPHFAFLCTCESADSRAEGALDGLAQRLVRDLGMPAVVGMTRKVSVQTALALGQNFYQRLRASGAVDVALQEATAGLGNRPDITVPALFSRLGGTPLFSETIFKVPGQSWTKYIAGVSAAILLGFVGVRLSLPSIATHFYTNPGTDNRKKGDWGTAEAQLQGAIKLNADDAQAHFQLGNLYEDLRQMDKAPPHYQLAISGGIPGATNNLARLYILKKDYDSAVSLLLKALDNDKRQPLSLQTKHAVLKNLGWARLKQKNYPDAQAKLEDAIDLETRTKFQPFEIADSHCLLAQVLEAQGDKTEALREWKICNQNARIAIPEQDEWVRIAQNRLIPKEPRK